MLGPLLFLVYINDITNYVLSSCWLFADDCVLYGQINSPTDAAVLQNDLKTGRKWKMKFNIEKCMVITVTLKKFPLFSEYYLHNHNLLLSLTLSTWMLLWTPHCHLIDI